MLLLSYCFDKIVCMCGCVCEYKGDKQKIYIAIYIYIYIYIYIKEMNAISKGQEFQIRKKLLKFYRCYQSPGKFICEETSKFPVNS